MERACGAPYTPFSLTELHKCTCGQAGVSALKGGIKGKERSGGSGQRSAEVCQPLGAYLFLVSFFFFFFFSMFNCKKL